MSKESDEYEVLEKIGHGSFGVIRKVRRKADAFIMCRKEISYTRMSQKEREQLHSEFQILSHLRHPNIVAYYHREHLKASQDLHLYMEYCGNGDLDRVIKGLVQKGQRAQESFVWSVFSQLVAALYRCHYGSDPPDVGANVVGMVTPAGPPKPAAGAVTILHRDLKPENVFLGEDNSVKLGDFGLSKIIKSHDFASTYVGTPFYMSPEICAAEKYTLKSDIWSLGCLIYELCAREPPFNAKTHYQLVQKIKEGKIASLPDVYSPELTQVIRDCLRVNPDRRPDTAQLLNLPVVRLMRKEKEVVDLNHLLRIREEDLVRRERQAADRLAALESEKEYIRQEIDGSLRREWEVKARLQIDHHVNQELQQLQARFESEVRARVQAELSRKKSSVAAQPEPTEAERPRSSTPSLRLSVSGQSSIGGASSGSSQEFSSTTDLSQLSDDSLQSSIAVAKRPARTPFARAHTMFVGHAGTPMDIEMGSPSPIAIASLSLSPRRAAATKPPVANTANIFTINAAVTSSGRVNPRWELPRDTTAAALLDTDEEDEDEDDMMPSPTRNIKSVKNPFTSKTRPVLRSQRSAPIASARSSKPPGATGAATASASATMTAPSANKALPALPGLLQSPNRRLSKIPSCASLAAVDCGSGTEAAVSRKPSSSRRDGVTLAPAPASAAIKNNNIRGRTLVELQQARAAGRPLSVVSGTGGLENTSPKRAFRDRVGGSGGESAPVWDPDRDEMPSPFLVRQKALVRA